MHVHNEGISDPRSLIPQREYIYLLPWHILLAGKLLHSMHNLKKNIIVNTDPLSDTDYRSISG